MRRTLIFIPLIAALCAAALGQAMIEYGLSGFNSSAATAKAAGITSKTGDALGRRLNDAVAGTGSGGSKAAQQSKAVQAKPSSSPEDPMSSNRRKREHAAAAYGAGVSGATLHVACVPQATLFVDRQAIARTPAELRLPAGQHILELKSPAYVSWSQEISVSGGENFSFEPTLKLQENKQAHSDRRIINLGF